MARPKKKDNRYKAIPLERSLMVIQTPERVWDLKAITELLDGNERLAEFFICWMRNGRNATRAYMEMHPTCNENSAAVLGSNILRNIKIPVILEQIGLGAARYLDQLDAGLSAEKKVVIRKYDKKTGALLEEIDLSQPDHKTRRLYHEPLGKMHGFEHERGEGGVNVQFNFDFAHLKEAIEQSARDRGLPT